MTQERCPRGESGDPRLGLAATGNDTTNRSPSVVDTRSGLLIVAHDLEHDPGELHDLADDKTRLAPFVVGLAKLRGQLQELPPR